MDPQLTPEQVLDEYLDEMSPARLEPIEVEGFVYISLDDFREYIVNRTLTANTANAAEDDECPCGSPRCDGLC